MGVSMLQRLIDKMIEREIEQKIIKPEEVSIYKYGYILVYEVVLNIILSVLIGILFDSIVNVLFFLVVFIPIRSFCGGWHADTIWKCTVVSNIILVLEIIYVENVIKHLKIWILYPIFVLFLIYIIYVAPVETRTKRISQNEKEVYRKKYML